ncbi:hypothetical protein KUV28_15050 [Ferrimonas balearica]|nr:hypothetical protein [Ferrimonas balearica]
MNPFAHTPVQLSGIAKDLAPVTPDDSADLPGGVAIGLYVVSGGSLSVVTVSGQTRTFTVPDFSMLPLGIARVLATGTTAEGIHAFMLA